MRRLSPLLLVLAFGCGPKPAPRPVDDPPALPPPKPDPDAPAADGSIPPPRPVLREYTPAEGTLAQAGRRLYLQHKCNGCHDGATNGPELAGLYGSKVELKDGGTALADENYLYDAIRRPKAQVTAGWEPIMPAYGPEELPGEQLTALIAYIRVMKKGEGKKEGAFPPPVGPPK
jgi:cytochrome c2